MTRTDRRRGIARSRKKSPLVADKRVRMNPDDRIDMILDGAAEFFAEHGFKAQTRELARRVGVSQSLIYHYFKTKNDLIERVYQRNFLSRWRKEWSTVICDRGVPLERRLKNFYAQYLEMIEDSDWIRIAMYSGLQDADLARRYIESQIEGLMRLIALEVAHDTGSLEAGGEPGEAEIELAWHLHSTFIYYLVRKHIFKTRVTRDIDALIDQTVDQFLAGAKVAAADGRDTSTRPGAAAPMKAERFSVTLTQPRSRSA